MSRRHAAEKREVNPDPKFGDIVVTKFMNSLMEDGKKSVAESIVYGAFDLVQAKLKQDPITVFHGSLDNIRPAVEVRTDRQQALAIRWLIESARKRGEHTMKERLAGELMDAVNGRGQAVKKREDTHRMADANRAFSHYRW